MQIEMGKQTMNRNGKTTIFQGQITKGYRKILSSQRCFSGLRYSVQCIAYFTMTCKMFLQHHNMK